MIGQVPTGRGCQDAWLWAIFCPRLGRHPLPITASKLELPLAVAPCISALLAAKALSLGLGLMLDVGLMLGGVPGQGTGLLPAGQLAVSLLDCTEDLNLCRKHWLKLPCEAGNRRCRAPGKVLMGSLCTPSCRDGDVADVLHAMLGVADCPVCEICHLWTVQRQTSCAMGFCYVQIAEWVSQSQHQCRDQAATTAQHEP